MLVNELVEATADAWVLIVVVGEADESVESGISKDTVALDVAAIDDVVSDPLGSWIANGTLYVCFSRV